MKNYLKIFITTILIIFSLNIQANEGINASECNQKIKTIFQQIESDFDEEEQDAALRENLTEKVFEKILGEGESLSEKRMDLSKNLGACLASPIEKDVAVKILRMLYGEVLNTPIKMISGIWGSFWDRNITVNEDNLNAETDILNIIPDLVKSYNNIIFSIALFIFAVIYGKEIISLLNTKNTRTLQFLGKNTLRILTGFSMIAPLPFLEGYSLIQFIFIIMLILAVLIAKVLWLFILLSINFAYFEKDLTEVVKQQQIKETFTNEVSSNIMMHYCDIVKRESFLQENLYEFNNRKSLLEQNEYYQCLKTETPLNKEDIFIPDQISIGEKCAIKHKSSLANFYYCGYIENFHYIPDDSIPKQVYKDIGIESREYQSKLRNVAIELRKHVCKVSGNNVIDAASNEFKCPILNGREYEHNPETDLLLFNNIKYTNEDQKRNELNRIVSSARSDIQNYMNQKIDIAVIRQISNQEASKETQEREAEKLRNFITLYEKGFAMAGSVFYEKIEYIQPSYDIINAFKQAYIVDTTVQIPLLEDRSKIENINPNGLNSGQIIDFDYETVVELTNSIWNEEILPEEEENRSIMLGINELVNAKTNCVVDFKECHVNSINPFLDLMHYGNEMVVFGTYSVVTVWALDKVYNRVFSNAESNYAANRGNELLGFIATLLNIYTLVGYFFSVFLPFIPFFTFAALFFGWILQSFKVIMASQLLSLYYIIPDEREDFAGKEKKVYKLLIKTALTPLFLITGFIVTLIIANISISLINVWLSIVMENLNLHPSLTSVLGILNGVIGIMIYAVLVTLAVLKANEAIAGIPKAISSWLDIQLEEEKEFNQLRNLVEAHIMPHMKGRLFF